MQNIRSAKALVDVQGTRQDQKWLNKASVAHGPHIQKPFNTAKATFSTDPSPPNLVYRSPVFELGRYRLLDVSLPHFYRHHSNFCPTALRKYDSENLHRLISNHVHRIRAGDRYCAVLATPASVRSEVSVLVLALSLEHQGSPHRSEQNGSSGTGDILATSTVDILPQGVSHLECASAPDNVMMWGFDCCVLDDIKKERPLVAPE